MRRFVLALLLVAGCASKPAHEVTWADFKDEIAFVRAKYGITTDKLPKLVITSQTDLIARTGSSSASDLSQFAVGSFVPRERAVYLSSQHLDLGSYRFRALVVHELVHAVQLYEGRWAKMSCIEKESEAYRVQNEYLIKHNVTPLPHDFVTNPPNCLGR